jgi:hypothetical protein
MNLEIASIITMLLAAFFAGYVVGVEHGTDEERRSHEDNSK